MNKLQKSEFEIAKKFKKTCDENNIKYTMLGGAMLGAIRHQGFIPWDDDMDFGLIRSDYEKLYNILLNHSDLKVLSYKKEDTHDYPFKIVDTSVQLKSKNYEKETEKYAWIDIFPLDGMPSNRILQKIHKLRLLKDRALLKLSQLSTGVAISNPNRTNFEKTVIFLGKLFKADAVLNEHKLMINLDRHLQLYSADNSQYLVNFMGAYKFKEMFPAEIYKNHENFIFENTFFCGIKNYDQYLRGMYGNYMQLPRLKDRDKHKVKINSVNH